MSDHNIAISLCLANLFVCGVGITTTAIEWWKDKS